MNLLLMTINILGILKQLPIDSKRKVAIDILERYQKRLRGEYMPAPTKDEIKIAIDAIKEIKQQWAISTQEYNAIEALAEYCKQLIDWEYKG